jgi:hypothetical protein
MAVGCSRERGQEFAPRGWQRFTDPEYEVSFWVPDSCRLRYGQGVDWGFFRLDEASATGRYHIGMYVGCCPDESQILERGRRLADSTVGGCQVKAGRWLGADTLACDVVAPLGGRVCAFHLEADGRVAWAAGRLDTIVGSLAQVRYRRVRDGREVRAFSRSVGSPDTTWYRARASSVAR